MEGPARMAREPGEDVGVLVGGVVVEDHVDHFPRRHLPFDRVQEADELLVAVARHAAADHRAVEHVERGEQGGGAVALVIVGHGARFAGLERQARLGGVGGLDLALLVERQHQAVRRRIEIEPDDRFELGGEVGIARALEGADAVRLHLERVIYDRYKVAIAGSVPVQSASGEAKLPFRIEDEIDQKAVRSRPRTMRPERWAWKEKLPVTAGETWP